MQILIYAVAEAAIVAGIVWILIRLVSAPAKKTEPGPAAAARPAPRHARFPLDTHIGPGATIGVAAMTISAAFVFAWILTTTDTPKSGAAGSGDYWYLSLFALGFGWLPPAITINIFAGTRGSTGRLFGLIGGVILLIPLFLTLCGVGLTRFQADYGY